MVLEVVVLGLLVVPLGVWLMMSVVVVVTVVVVVVVVSSRWPSFHEQHKTVGRSNHSSRVNLPFLSYTMVCCCINAK